MLLDVLADDSLQVLGVVEEGADSLQRVLNVVHKLLAFLSGLCLDTADAGCNAALRDNLEETDATGRLCVDTTAELAAGSETHHAYLVAILLAEECDGTELLCLLKRSVAMLVERQVLTYKVVDQTLYLAQFLV